jgi:hypothetical protein
VFSDIHDVKLYSFCYYRVVGKENDYDNTQCNVLIWRGLDFTSDTLWDIYIQIAWGVLNTDILIKGSNSHQSVNTDSALYKGAVQEISNWPIWHLTIDSLYTGLLINPSRTSELSCTTTKTDTAERNIPICAESLQVFFCFCLRCSTAYLQVSPLGGSHDETWRGIRKRLVS